MFSQLMNFLFQKEDCQVQWKRRTVNTQECLGIRFPILYMDNDLPHEFSVFYKKEELVYESICGHWGWNFQMTQDVNDTHEVIIDSNGIQYTVDHQVYSEEFKQGCSYAGEISGAIELNELKRITIHGLNQYVENIYPEKSAIIKDFITIINNTDTFEELISSLDVDVHQI